jgi:methyltransferase
VRLAICAYMAGARLIELAISRRNIDANPSAEGDASQRLYPVMVLLHTSVIGGTLLFGQTTVRGGWLAALLLVQPLRFWVLRTLGPRWNTRGAVPVNMEVETSGPYAYLRHPNYSVVAVELAALPATFGLGRLAMVASTVNALLMVVRIRDEEKLLFSLPCYEEHFRKRRRFLPFII